ncbi:MAG: peptidoglycan-binding protein [Elainella sp. Prado103]|nr:peptidoglycan-binding protein [Elainella sp. Prado103]
MIKAIVRYLDFAPPQSQISFLPALLPAFLPALSAGLLTALIPIMVAIPVKAQSYADPTYANTLQADDRGESVAALQQRLADLGYYNGSVTGYFDGETQAAVTQFQQSNGLAADGIVGTATTDALYQGGTPQTARTGWNRDAYPNSDDAYPNSDRDGLSSDTSIVNLQQQLTQLGYYNGDASGVFDETTRSAVMAFQRDRGLAVDGIVGQQTESALYQTGTQPNAAIPATTTEDGVYSPNPTPNDGFLQFGDVGTDVTQLQTQLQALGYYNGAISGSFEDQTQAALIAFQQAHGLSADGVAGPQVNSTLSSIATSLGAPATPQAATTSTVTTSTAITPTAITPTAITPTAITPTVTTPTVTQPSMTQFGSPAVVQPTGTAAVIPQTLPAQTSTVQVPPLPPAALPPAIPQIGQPPENSSALPPQASTGSSRSDNRFSVTELQRRLQLRGFNPVDMTGVYDVETQNAINQAQEAYGLSGDDLFN